MPAVSIITPAYRAVGFIGRAVHSVLQQSFQDWEMIIISDDGEDYQTHLARQGICDRRLRFLSTGVIGSGPNAPRNLGLSVARGRFIAPLDADDLFYADRLQYLLPIAETHGVAADNVRVVDDTDSRFLNHLLDDDCHLHWLDMPGFIRLSIPVLLLCHRSLVVQGWDEDVVLGADTLFNLRVIEGAGLLPVTGRALHEYRVRQGSICHAGGSAVRAEQGYTHSLELLAQTGLGFRGAAARRLVKQMLENKRALNRRYMEYQSAGGHGDFQQFLLHDETTGAAA